MIRRKHILALTVTLMLLPLLTTCSMEERLRPVTGAGVPASVTLSFGVNGHTVYTRASQSEEDENRVDNLYILVFRKDNGELVNTTNDEGERLNFFTTSPQDDFSGLSYNAENQEGSVRFTADYSGDVIIVGVANIKEGDVDTGYDLTKADLDSFEGTLDEFKEYVVSRNVPEDQSPVSRGSHFLMTGSVETTIGTTADYDVLEDELVLERVDAKIIVNVKSGGDLLPENGGSFEPKSLKLVNIPMQSYLLSKSGEAYPLDADGEECRYETCVYRFDDITSEDDGDQTLRYTGGTFTFYMPENLKGPKAPAESYADRERREDSSSPLSDSNPFKYAHQHATYMEINGYVSYTDPDEGIVNADVTFIVHLGYVSPEKNVDDYDTERNSKYTYNITVTGINSLETNVYSENGSGDERPGYEGNVVKNNEQVFYLDSHYETRLIKLDANSINDEWTWSIVTPKGSGIYKDGDDISGWDYEWIKFAINQNFGEESDNFVKFPGININYYNPDITSADEMGGKRLLNIYQLLKYLKANKNNFSGSISITAFIDEYYYDDLDWKRFVNTFDRQMHIIDGGIDYSDDGNSSIGHANYSFVQRSIRSIYNTNADEKLHTAWGVETITEPVGKDQSDQDITLLPPGVNYISGLGENSDRKNGKANTETLWSGNYLPNIIEYRTNTLNDSYRNAVYACMLRNRDEDGNDRIDSDELKWYLAAIDQLVDLYIGEWALNQASRLYPFDPAAGDYPPSNTSSNTVYWHYTSSSANAGESYHPWVLWAEEGASIGSYDKPKDDSDSKRFVNDRYSYRCLRNLGEGDPQDFVQIDGNTINLSWLNPDARREKSDNANALDAHNQKSEVNRPFEQFVVGELAPTPEYHGKNGSDDVFPWDQSSEEDVDLVWSNLKNWNEVDGKDENPCPPKYRVPNQRELLIMATRYGTWPTYSVEVFWYEYQWNQPLRPAQYEKTLTEEPPFYLSQTAFSLNGKPPYNNLREGFIYSTTGDIFQLQNDTGEKGYVRCIRDIE